MPRTRLSATYACPSANMLRRLTFARSSVRPWHLRREVRRFETPIAKEETAAEVCPAARGDVTQQIALGMVQASMRTHLWIVRAQAALRGIWTRLQVPCKA
jgi:hypothetical protein